ncbi:SUKH-4 family immunity protein [Streptomyces sp. NPDC017673]|uniref:SUKH-4 family immunity protein n=1 Tax=unclassified Streptomyces TaxID=2593676 RepID=UPI00379DC9E6
MTEVRLRMAAFKVRGVPGIENLDLPADSLSNVYKPVEPLEIYESEGGVRICIGRTGIFGRFVLDVQSGKIIEESEDYSYSNFVNSSLTAFIQCLQMLSALLDGVHEGEDEELANMFESQIRQIDPQAYREGSFWYEIRWSIAIGDFS